MILSSVQAGQVVLRQIRNAIDAHKIAGGHHKIYLDGALGRAVAVVNVQQTGQHQFAAEHLNGRVVGDVQGQARHIHGNVTDGNVKCLAA